MYGTLDEVAAIVPRYTDTVSRQFTQSTRPSLAQVTRFMERLSDVVDVMLGNSGIQTPLTNDKVKSAVSEIVIEGVVDMCHAANSAGRFFSDNKLKGKSPFAVIREDIAAWIEMNAAGLVAAGATVFETDAGRIGYRDTDEAGDPTFPLFQRDGFDNVFTDWDPKQ